MRKLGAGGELEGAEEGRLKLRAKRLRVGLRLGWCHEEAGWGRGEGVSLARVILEGRGRRG